MMFCMFYLMCSIQLLLRLCPRPYQWWRGWWGQWGKWGQCATATPAAAGASALRANTWAAGPNGASCTASQERSSENRFFFGHPEEGKREQEVLPGASYPQCLENEQLDGFNLRKIQPGPWEQKSSPSQRPSALVV